MGSTADPLRPQSAALEMERGQNFLTAGNLAAAIDCLGRAVSLAPEEPAAQYYLAVALVMQGRFDEAAAAYRRVLQLDPRSPLAEGGLGNVLRFQDRPAEALACYHRALALSPDNAEAHCCCGLALEGLGQVREAMAHYRRVIELEPGHVGAHWNLARALLLLGQFDEGWREYEWRLRLNGAAESLPGTRWDGASLAGKTIFLQCEQGIGDSLQVVRYAPLLQQRGATVLFGCQASCASLIARCSGVAQAVAVGEPVPHYDCWLPQLSLPGLMHPQAGDFSNNVPYLLPDNAAVARWRDALGPKRAFRVGISWQGNPRNTADRARSLPLALFEPLAAIEGVELISLQFGAGAEQLAAIRGAWRVTDLGDRLGDFQNTAALVRNLDLMITCDSALAHLAGGLGVPVWTLLSVAPDWRWMLLRGDSPWYPTMRLFRQPRQGDWRSVMQQVEQALHIEVARSGFAR